MTSYIQGTKRDGGWELRPTLHHVAVQGRNKRKKHDRTGIPKATGEASVIVCSLNLLRQG
jgi:hypothetical protein